MYYVHDLLAFRTGTFGKLWFVAHNPSKLKSRREFEAVIIEKKCRELLEHFPFSAANLSRSDVSLNGIPLSIRTCSHIMFGIVVVFHKQCEFLYQDSKRLLTDLKPMKLNLKDPKKARDLAANDFMIPLADVPPFLDNWQLELTSPTEQARFLDMQLQQEGGQILITNAGTRVDNIRDITMRGDENDPRLLTSNVYQWTMDGQGLHPDDRPLNEQEIQQQWMLMNSSTDVIAEFLMNPGGPSTSGGVLPLDPGAPLDAMQMFQSDTQQVQRQSSLDLTGVMQLQDTLRVIPEVRESVIQDPSVAGQSSNMLVPQEQQGNFSEVSSALTTASPVGRMMESEALNRLMQELTVDVANKENVSMPVQETLSQVLRDAISVPGQDLNVVSDAALIENQNLQNAGLSVTLRSDTTPILRASESLSAMNRFNGDLMLKASISDTVNVENRRKVTPSIGNIEQNEAPARISKSDALLQQRSRYSDATIRPFPDLFNLQPGVALEKGRRKRRPKFIDEGPIEIGNKAFKMCLEDNSDILTDFVPAANRHFMKAEELMSSAGRQMGKDLQSLWAEQMDSLEISWASENQQQNLPMEPTDASAEIKRHQESRNVTDPLGNSSRQLPDVTPRDPMDPLHVTDPKTLSMSDAQNLSKSYIESDTLRTIPEVRETVVPEPLPLDNSMLPPPVLDATHDPNQVPRGNINISLDFDTSLSLNRNDEKVLSTIQCEIEKNVMGNNDENVQVNSIQFDQLCDPGMCKKRQACRMFYSLLHLAKSEKVLLHQQVVGQNRKPADPIVIQIRSY